MLTTTDLKYIGYDRATKGFRAECDGNVIGFFPNYSAAEEALNDYVLGLCEQGLLDAPLAALVPEGTDEDDFSDVPAGPGEPRTDSAVRAHLTYGHLRRDLFAPVFFCACGARASIVVYGNPDVMRCDACHTAGPAYHAPGYCANCGGPHATQRCPEIAQALRAAPIPAVRTTARAWLADDWRRDHIARQWSERLRSAADASAESYDGMTKALS